MRHMDCGSFFRIVVAVFLVYPLGAKAISGDVDITLRHQQGGRQKNIGNEIIYQIVVDRFANGNFENDCPYDRAFCQTDDTSSDENWYRYQGGDLRGIIKRLDYLKQLGVSRLWLTPIFENQMITTFEPRFGSYREITSYHGYWIRDWFRLNPFFVDQRQDDFATFADLIRQAKDQAGIKIYLDTVANHTSPLRVTSWSLDQLNDREPLGEGQSHRGALFEQGRYLTSYDEDRRKRHLDSLYQRKFHHFEKDIGQVNGASDWDNGFILENYNLSGLADLDQEHPEVFDYLQRAHEFWLQNFPDLAGYRIDTIKHVPTHYWQKFSQALFSKFPRAEVFGEYFGGGGFNGNSIEFYNTTEMSMLDFNFREAMVNVFLNNKSFAEILSVWKSDVRFTDAASLITFLDSHDYPRVRGMGLTKERLKLALVLWLTSRGVPCIYYGMEQDLFFPNDPGDPFNRPMMASFNPQAEIFQLLKILIKLRRDHPALRWGDTHIVHLTEDIIGFERRSGERKVFVAMSKNQINGGTDKFRMRNLSLPNGNYLDHLSATTYRVEGGEISLELGYGEFVLLEL